MQQIGRGDGQGIRQAPQRPDTWVSHSALKITEIAALHPSAKRQLFLREAEPLAMCAHVETKKLDDVHERRWPERSHLRCPLIVSFLHQTLKGCSHGYLA